MENDNTQFDFHEIALLINQRPGRMIQLASLLNCQATFAQDFGDGYPITTVESGLLMYISNNPGVTNAILAEQFGRTKGAISHLVKSLEANEYIVREMNPNDAKSSLLYLSLKGMKLIKNIIKNDFEDENGMLRRLIATCSVDDLHTFFRMVDTYSVLLIEMLAEKKKQE